jgi:neopullulanase
MSRAYTQLGERLDLYKMAIAFFATTRGIPQLTYGSEILMANPGTDAHGAIRKDFPGGWAADPTDGFTGRGLTPEQREAQDFMRKLLNWRKRATAVHRGGLTQYAPQDGVYAYFRHDARQTVMVVLNKSSQERRIDTARFHQVIGSRRQAADVLSGRIHRLDESLAVPGQSVTILELGPPPAP